MNEFRINPYLSVRLKAKKTMIYVADQPFKQCKLLLLNIPIADVSAFDDIESIDEFAEDDDRMMESEMMRTEILPDVEFWGHCSNLQAWYEHDYDTRLIHSNLAFPLLKELTEVGDPLAKKVFKSEIIKRFEQGNENTRSFLGLEGFLQYLTDEEYLDLKLDTENLIALTELAEEVWPDRNPYEVTLMLVDGKRIKLENKRVVSVSLNNLKLSKFPEVILNFKTLKVLNLRVNNIKVIPTKINNLSSLKELWLDFNRIESLPESISEIMTLEQLWLDGNKLIDLPKNFENLENLRMLRLIGNRLQILPKSLSKLTLLEHLDLSNNALDIFPDSLCELRALKWLSLASNNLSKLRECIKNLPLLEYLDVSRNPLVKNLEIVQRLEKLKIKEILGIKRKRKAKSFRIH